MIEKPEKSDKELNNKPSLSAEIKKLWVKAKNLFVRIGDWLYNVMGSIDFWYWYTYSEKWKIWIYWLVGAKYEWFILCWDNFIWAFRDGQWRLLDKEGKEKENFWADYVKDLSTDYTKGWITEWRIYSIDWNRWMVADNWTIIPANYVDMYQCSSDNDGFDHAFIVWKEKLKTWEEKLWQISMEDGSITEYKKVEENEPENEIIDGLKSEYRDHIYNIMFSDKISIYEWWKKRRVSTYMSKWKIWIEWMEAHYDDLYIPFKGYSIGIAKVWDKSWLISMRDGSTIREIEYNNIITDNKTKSLILVKWDDIEEVYCDSYKESKHQEKADS